jgi:hypothetical protein
VRCLPGNRVPSAATRSSLGTETWPTAICSSVFTWVIEDQRPQTAQMMPDMCKVIGAQLLPCSGPAETRRRWCAQPHPPTVRAGTSHRMTGREVTSEEPAVGLGR